MTKWMWSRRTSCGASLLSALLLAGPAGCGSDGTPTSPVAPSPASPQATSASEAVLVGAGDISECQLTGAEQTAVLVDRLPGTVFTAGDNAYMDGSAKDFECYQRTWGRHRSRTWPAPGNHDYQTPGASGYFQYFGERAGPMGLGYYSFDLGAWHVVSLNSNVAMAEGSAQVAWLRSDLQRTRATCIAAVIHHPLVSSGPNGDNPQVRDLWRALYDAGTDIVISGHDHIYERHRHLNPDGRPDPRGARLFIVGTGGARLYHAGGGLRPTTEARAVVWGVVRFVLQPGTYRWEFHSVEGILDSGIDICEPR